MKNIFTIVGILAAMTWSPAQIVIHEIYTGGGLPGAAVTRDYVELRNIGDTVETLTGATIQYGPATGPLLKYYNIPEITLEPGRTYLISQGADTAGGLLNLPNANLLIDVVLDLDGGPAAGVGAGLTLTSGKVALATNATRVTGPEAANVIDFVGYGLADQYEGAGPAPSPTVLNAISRRNIPVDTDNNNLDFILAQPSPQPTGTLATSEEPGQKQASFIKNTLVRDTELIFTTEVKDLKIYTFDGRLIKSAPASANQRLNIADLPKGNYMVVGKVDDRTATQKIIKN